MSQDYPSDEEIMNSNLESITEQLTEINNSLKEIIELIKTKVV